MRQDELEAPQGRGALLDEEAARAAGRKARREGHADDPPGAWGLARSLRVAWRAGWAEVDVPPPPPPLAPRPCAVDASVHWPEGQPMPTRYVRRPLVPCPTCRLVVGPDGRRAVAVRGIAGGTAYLECRCGARWKLMLA